MGVIKNNSNDINHTTARTLVNATGISHCLAKAIINYRKQKQNNPIEDFHELWKVPGMTSEDYEAIAEEFKKSKPQDKQPVTKVNVKSETTKGKDSVSKEKPTSSPNSTQGRNTARNRRKRERKKRKKQERMASTSPAPSSLKRDTDKINSKAINQRIRTGMNKANLSHNGFQIPNLLVNPEWESPQNTLILLTGGSGQKQMLMPYKVRSYQDGQEFVVRYLNQPHVDDLFSQSSNPRHGGKQTKNSQDRSLSASPERRHASTSRSGSRGRSRSRSRSSKSTTTSPPEKRSRSNPPSNSDYSGNNVKIIEMGSVVPQGPGSNTLRSDITIPANAEWSKNDHESVRNWLAGVGNENIISSSGQGTRVRSISADSRLTTGENSTRRRLDFDQQKPSTSAGKSSQIGQRKPNEFDGNYPTMSRDKSRQSPGIFSSSKQVYDTVQRSRERNRDVSLKRQRHGASRHKSRHQWKSRVDPEDGILEDERRPIEARLDRPRDDNTGLTAKEMRRAKKQDLERQQLRHRNRSRARSRAKSRARWRKRFFNCTVM
ncbi:hypothetical protein LOTGIDRAFT_232573 [Lottia gigantea]|uniref:Uncharacterized protein n=1 Tax=Lottia gigantea TaxID=225164 RepID=V4BZ06_LOTGI|nr:hypothetical protein LOTGIDRAFT_232573 [Lottia gigantea]ESO94349.1 hypothetical protein LOTGIDRAFT_232573 [Lottia gigantea]